MSSFRLWMASVCGLVLWSPCLASSADELPPTRGGQLHVVVSGDTLWDITEHYLDTPWIWPSIWHDNGEIENPHRIFPGDLIWISPEWMGKVTRQQAADLLRAPRPAPLVEPASPQPEPEPEDARPEPDPFLALDQGATTTRKIVNFPGLDRYGLVSPEQFKASGAVLGSHEEHYWSSQLQRTIVSLGEGQVHVGDNFTVYRVRRRVLHPDTGLVLGYFVQVLGKVEIVEIHPEASYVRVVDAYVEIEPGDLLIPYEESPTEIAETPLDKPVKGTIVAHQPYRIYSGWNDLVVLDRGSIHGVQLGHRFSIYRAGKEVRDPVLRTKIMVPDDMIGRLFVVKVTSSTALALVTQAHRKIREGDRFRNL